MQNTSFVAIIDDDPDIRDMLVLLLDSVALPARAYAGAADFLDDPDLASCACLVLDVRMPGMSGPELQRRLLEAHEARPTVFISGHGDFDTAVQVMKRGAVDFLKKPFSGQAFIDAVQGALERRRQGESSSQRHAELTRRFECLTPRERKVFELLGQGLLAKQVASELGVSLKTVEEHRSNIFAKLAIRRSADLVALATELRLLGRDARP